MARRERASGLAPTAGLEGRHRRAPQSTDGASARRDESLVQAGGQRFTSTDHLQGQVRETSARKQSLPEEQNRGQGMRVRAMFHMYETGANIFYL